MLATGSWVGSAVEGVFVRPVQQRRGYGKAMMTYLEEKGDGAGDFGNPVEPILTLQPFL